MNSKKTILAILAGFAAGAVLGVLFAPDKGSGTRRTILSKGGSLSNRVQGKVDEKLNRIVATLATKDKSEEALNDLFYDD